ncbi:uncharacterized protein B0H18DRAFT_1016557 [Fomitopsis serialis]|uniref:uncharacterized protein n=1 Tax=Fomitopsis serialis TaxID=139415 RepID=UPI0020089516|nr:uncharacterized protein B0H18DRAFT_1016557 [Neoantrodia serialis]KAH9922711.1 hypothetical protein B0H18DRAFT_1016557 [Neoantrodia serialis]
MIVHFVKNNRHAGSSPVSRMLTFIVESGALLAIFTLVELILFIVEPQTNLHLLLYVNSDLMFTV